MLELSIHDTKLLEEICKLRQPLLMRTVYKYLKKLYGKNAVCTPDYVYAKGSIPVALIAHMDTVFPKPPSDIYYDRKKGVMWSPEGMGADDRAGVFLILKLLKTTTLRPSVIFTTGEESGGIGASELVRNVKEPFTELKYLIQLDRRGTNDCVFYDCENPQFVKYIESFGFIESIGSFSDISEICPAWKIAGVNLSVGYEDEHTYTERLYVRPMMATYEKMKNMLMVANEAPKFEWIPSKYALAYNAYGLSSDDYYKYMCGWDDYPVEPAGAELPSGFSYASGNDDDMEFPLLCNGCEKVFLDYELFPVLKSDGGYKYYCADCMSDHIKEVQWCYDCGEAFEIDLNHADECKCKRCKEKVINKEKVKSWKTPSSKTSKINSSESSATPKA